MTLQKNWTSPPRNPDAEAQLIQQLKIKPLLARTLVARGLSDPENAAAFLQEQAAPFYDPFLFKDMDIAVRRIKAAIHKKEHITVYGDYDADGVCATSLLLSYLQSVGAVADHYIPSRLTEGYGMNESALSLIAERGTTLIITVDTGIAALSEDNRSLIIDSRMAWHFTKGTFKVYLSCDSETSALRIMNAKRSGESTSTLEEMIDCTKARRASEKKRYMEQYGVDIKDLANYSLIVDTSVATPDQVAECIISGFERWQADKSYCCVFLSPERLHFPERELDGDSLSPFTQGIERGEELNCITVCEKDGEFYLVDGFEAAIAHVFNFSPFIPCRLVKAEPSGEYVRMRNSL
jgi:cytidylate kinase